MKPPHCRKHDWSTDVRLNRLHCSRCPATITVKRYDQLQRAAAIRRTVAAIRKRDDK